MRERIAVRSDIHCGADAQEDLTARFLPRARFDESEPARRMIDERTETTTRDWKWDILNIGSRHSLVPNAQRTRFAASPAAQVGRTVWPLHPIRSRDTVLLFM